ncbi:MAG: MerR family transcriptional regulator [Oscillospiraceae bacterium]|nr:MerR family transcriptional regulator [Oscillospiraceae bacterium]
MYTIGQVSEMTGLPVSTLRYYDKQGLFPNMQRSGGIRQFGDGELETLRVIECLKRSGLEIKDIRQFMEWSVQGSETYPLRRALLAERKASLEAELEQMGRALDMLKYKCWYYDQAILDGNEERLRSIPPADMPEDIRRAYENAHTEEASVNNF